MTWPPRNGTDSHGHSWRYWDRGHDQYEVYRVYGSPGPNAPDYFLYRRHGVRGGKWCVRRAPWPTGTKVPPLVAGPFPDLETAAVGLLALRAALNA